MRTLVAREAILFTFWCYEVLWICMVWRFALQISFYTSILGPLVLVHTHIQTRTDLLCWAIINYDQAFNAVLHYSTPSLATGQRIATTL